MLAGCRSDGVEHLRRNPRESRSSLNRRIPILLLAVLAACTSDGPKFAPDEADTVILQGGMPDESVVFDRQTAAVTGSGTVNFEMTVLEARNFVTGELFENAALVVNFGTPGINLEGQETCQVTVSNFLAQGDRFSLGLAPGIYCLVLIRPDERVIPGTAIIDYTMTLTGAFS